MSPLEYLLIRTNQSNKSDWKMASFRIVVRVKKGDLDVVETHLIATGTDSDTN